MTSIKCLIITLFALFCLCSALPRVVNNVQPNQECCSSTTVFDPNTQYCCNGVRGTYAADDLRGAENCCGSRPTKTGQTCCNNVLISNPNNLACCGSSLIQATQGCCNGRSFTTATQKCCETSGVVIAIEGECCGTGSMTAGFLCCNGRGVDPNSITGSNACCGNEFDGTAFDSRTEKCCQVTITGIDGGSQERGVVARGLGECCGSNSRTLNAGEVCCPNAQDPRASILTATANRDCCGNQFYNTLTQECCSIEERNLYRILTLNLDGGLNQQCCYSIYDDRVNLFDPSIQLCCENGLVSGRNDDLGLTACCNGASYDQRTHQCCGNNLVCGQGCCGTNGYYFDTEICCEGNVYRQYPSGETGCCSGVAYDMTTHTCCVDTIYKRQDSWTKAQCCGDYYFNAEKHVCCNPPSDAEIIETNLSQDLDEAVGKDYVKCGDNCCGNTGFFNDYQTCCDSTIYDHNPGTGYRCCASSIYDADLTTVKCCCDVTDFDEDCQ